MKLTKEYLNTLQPGKINKKVYFSPNQYEVFNTYKIPLKDLIFNVKNGRINTYIWQYDNDKQNLPLGQMKDVNPDNFNQVMINFIKQSGDDNEESFNKTKNDIAKKGQITPGIVLEDGTVIDGNRRLSCLMELFNETHDDKYAYFEACCLPSLDEKQVQIIELNANYDVDSIRPYSLIESLVQLYQLVFNPQNKFSLSKQDYIDNTGLSQKDVDKAENLINIMLDFLQWNDTAYQFSLIRKNNLIQPLTKIAEAKIDSDIWHENRDKIYNLLILKDYKLTDLTSLLHALKENNTMLKSYSEEYDKINPDQTDEYKALNNKTNLTDNEQARKEELMHSLSGQINKAITYGKFKQSVDSGHDNVIDLLDKILLQMHHKINKQDVVLLSENDQITFKEKIDDFHQYLNQLLSYLNKSDEPVIKNNDKQD